MKGKICKSKQNQEMKMIKMLCFLEKGWKIGVKDMKQKTIFSLIFQWLKIRYHFKRESSIEAQYCSRFSSIYPRPTMGGLFSFHCREFLHHSAQTPSYLLHSLLSCVCWATSSSLWSFSAETPSSLEAQTFVFSVFAQWISFLQYVAQILKHWLLLPSKNSRLATWLAAGVSQDKILQPVANRHLETFFLTRRTFLTSEIRVSKTPRIDLLIFSRMWLQTSPLGSFDFVSVELAFHFLDFFDF